jgi:hypothetical protein
MKLFFVKKIARKAKHHDDKVYKYKGVSNRFNYDIFLVFVFKIHVKSYNWKGDCTCILYISRNPSHMPWPDGAAIPSHIYYIVQFVGTNMGPKCLMPSAVIHSKFSR